MSHVNGDFTIALELLHLALPDGAGVGSVSADWLVAANLELAFSGSGPIKTPELAGFAVGRSREGVALGRLA